jgi:uncharacterized protein (DUF2249 family)
MHMTNTARHKPRHLETQFEARDLTKLTPINLRNGLRCWPKVQRHSDSSANLAQCG